MNYCECNCGQIVSRDSKDRQPRFIKGHHARGSLNPNWKGGRFASPAGYIYVKAPDDPRATPNGYVREHVLIAERALAKALPEKAVVHHVDGDPSNNEKCNLLVCDNQGYHLLLHRRQRALNESGHAHWMKCSICGRYDDPTKMYIYRRKYGQHRECKREYQRRRRAAIHSDGLHRLTG